MTRSRMIHAHISRLDRPPTLIATALLIVGALVAAACGGGDSALDAGNEDGDPPPTPVVAEPIPELDDNDGDDGSVGDDGGVTTTDAEPGEGTPGATGAGTQPATTSHGAATDTTTGPTTTLAPLAELPPCPVEAVDAAAGPVAVTFWHSMANELETALIDLVDTYNAGQDRVVVDLQNQTAYESTIDKYIEGGVDSRPDIVQLPEYIVQSFAESDTFVPVESCIEASGFDMSPMLPRVTDTYAFQGTQWAMPFNVSNPVYFYNRLMFDAAGLDPDDPPITLDELRDVSQAIVDSGAATYGIALDSGRDAGGGWFFEQWFGRAGQPYADNGNGRLAPATQVLFDNELGVELLTYLQNLIADGLAVTVGDNAGGQDTFLKMIDAEAPAASTIASSAAIASVIAALGSGVASGLTPDDIGVGPMPGPSPEPAAQVGGAALWIPAGKSEEVTAAAWDFTRYLVEAQTQSRWAAGTGYIPIRTDAVELDPIASLYERDPRYRVAFDQLQASADDPSAVVPALGPLRQIRAQTADAVAAVYAGEDVEAVLAETAAASNALIDSYNAQN